MKNLTIICSVRLIVFLPLAIVIGCAAPAPETVIFSDENLEKVIRDALDKPTGEATTPVELAKLKELTANKKDITDLSGIEYCTNLVLLSLEGNQVSDISPLASLSNLKYLSLGSNQISDISPLNSLSSLASLRLRINQVSDISPLASLTKLEFL